MEGSFIDVEVLHYKKSSITHSDIEKLRGKHHISPTRNEEDVILGTCGEGEAVCLYRLQGGEGEFFYFYIGLLEDFKIQFPFSDFVSELLTTLNIVPTQVHLNGWGFVQAFELICESLNIDPTLGIFFAFFELNGADKGSFVSLNGASSKSFLRASTSNYKYFKDRFFRVRCGSRCPGVLYGQGGNRRFPFYWTDIPVPVFGFDYDKQVLMNFKHSLF